MHNWKEEDGHQSSEERTGLLISEMPLGMKLDFKELVELMENS